MSGVSGRKADIHNLIATVFHLGYFPAMPGTIGSLAGLILCVSLHSYPVLYITVFILLFILGVISAHKIEEKSRQKDPSFIVIDEFACIFLVFLFIPLNIFTLITGFILYRLIDITKPPPIRRLEKIRGGWGIMLDDLVSGIYANIILQAILFIRLKT